MALFIASIPVLSFLFMTYTSHVVAFSTDENVIEDCFLLTGRNASTKESIQTYCIDAFVDMAFPNHQADGETINFINSLFRKVIRREELNKRSRHKRQTGQIPIRSEVRASPYSNWERYATAVQRLKRTPSPEGISPNAYDAIARIHTGSLTQHQGPAFLSWHRIYLLLLEEQLGTTIPYWDSSLDYHMTRPDRTVLFTAKYFGNGFGRVMTGFFGNLPGRAILRNIGATGRLIPKDSTQFGGIYSVLHENRHADIVNPARPRSYWEGHHNGVHRWVDETMANSTIAAYDPIFFCHHAFIDFIWEVFRRRITNPETDYVLGFPLHAPNMQMTWNGYPNAPMLTNIQGYSNYYAAMRRYAEAPSCRNNCAGSNDLLCTGTICISREATLQERIVPGDTIVSLARAEQQALRAGFSATAGVITQTAMDTTPLIEIDSPERTRTFVEAFGAPEPGTTFQLFGVDPRTRQDAVVRNIDE